MIVCGYQGIGKSTLAKREYGIIDLESSNFHVKGVPENWYVYYVNTAYSLHNQGYVVLLSSHKVVCEELRNRAIDAFVCYPRLDLRSEWLERLKDRYESTTEEPEKSKNFRAWKNAEDAWVSSITALANSDLHKILITSMKYDLGKMLESFNMDDPL